MSFIDLTESSVMDIDVYYKDLIFISLNCTRITFITQINVSFRGKICQFIIINQILLFCISCETFDASIFLKSLFIKNTSKASSNRLSQIMCSK